MSAQAELQAAQAATRDAVQALADLNARVDGGDATVMGADLLAAEAQVSVVSRLEAGAAARADAEMLARQSELADAAQAKLRSDYEETTEVLRAAVKGALDAALALQAAASAHERRTKANRTEVRAYGAQGLGDQRFSSALNGFSTPSFVELFEGVVIVTSKATGMRMPVSYPDTALQPIRQFLPAPDGRGG